MFVELSKERPGDRARGINVYFTKQDILDLVSHMMDKPLKGCDIGYHAGTIDNYRGKDQIHSAHIVKDDTRLKFIIDFNNDMYRRGL